MIKVKWLFYPSVNCLYPAQIGHTYEPVMGHESTVLMPKETNEILNNIWTCNKQEKSPTSEIKEPWIMIYTTLDEV